MVANLGRVERIDDLRSIWRNEATDFTPWLQQNIDLLSEALGLDIQLVEREVEVGDFSVDLVGEEPGSARPVIIENQLERTNHDHLGKLLTYSAGKGGGVIVWVAKEIRPEHRNALEWLNKATQGSVEFYGVELELLRISDSPLAPNFKVVVGPTVTERGSGPSGSGEPSERGQHYQAFFAKLLERIKARPPRITNQTKVGYQSWLSTSSGKRGFSFGFAFVRGQKFQIELYIDMGSHLPNKQAFNQLYLGKDTIEEELGAALDWQRLDNRRACRIAWYWHNPVSIMDGEQDLEKLKEWAVENYFKFREVLSQHLENLPSAYETAAPIDTDEPQRAGLIIDESA